MGRLTDQLRREQEQDAARENQRTVSELVSNEDTDGERQAGRRTGGGFSALAAEACEKARLSGENTRAILRAKTGRDNG